MSIARPSRLLIVVVFIACAKAKQEAPAPPTATQPAAPVWQSSLVTCTPELCGAVDANYGSMALQSGSVSMDVGGLVTMRMRGYVDANGVRGADRTLQVFFGRFSPAGFQGVGDNPVGTFTTDGQGNYEGTITNPAGYPYHVHRGVDLSGYFIVNQPGVRSLFVTESAYSE